MGMHPTHILSGFLLETDAAGTRPAINDVSGDPLFAEERMQAAIHLAESGARFFCVGTADQTHFMTNVLPGDDHSAVENPDQFTPNTLGNIEQVRAQLGEAPDAIGLFNLYHCYRWHEWTGIPCQPVEAVLLAHDSNSLDLKEMFGTSTLGYELRMIVRDSAARIRSGETGVLTAEELSQHNEIIRRMPTSDTTGPTLSQIPPDLMTLFDTPYLRRIRGEWCGVADKRAGTYHSFRPRPE